jgi:hypothetical protein
MDSIKYGKNYKVYCIITEIGPNPSFYWDNWDNKTRLQRTADSLLGCDLYMVKCAGFYPVLKELKVTDNVVGNNDGILDPGETATITARIENKSVVDTTPDVKAILSTSFGLCRVSDSAGSFGAVRLLSEATNTADPFTVSCQSSAQTSALVRFELKVTWTMNSVSFEKALPCSLRLGTHVGVSYNRENGQTQLSLALSRSDRNSVKISLLRNNSAIPENAIQITLLDASGRAINKFSPRFPRAQCSLSVDLKDRTGASLKPGFYFLHISAGDKMLAVERMAVVE